MVISNRKEQVNGVHDKQCTLPLAAKCYFVQVYIQYHIFSMFWIGANQSDSL